MNSSMFDVFSIGISASVLAGLILVLLVFLELGPFAGLAVEGKWLLGGTLGVGVLAFAVKMLIAAAIIQYPDTMTRPWLQLSALGLAPPQAGDAFAAATSRRYVWQALPLQAPQPAANPGSPAKVALGRRLFNETQLSADGTQSCASCHALTQKAGADGRVTAVGIRGQQGPRNTPTVWNAAFQQQLFWDGRAASLEEQAKGPILNPLEMGLPTAAVAEARIRQLPGYAGDFAAAFGDAGISFERMAMALAAYERTLITADSPYDRYVRGERQALDAAQRRGMALFDTLNCVLCHNGPNFSAAGLGGSGGPRRLFPANPSVYEQRYRLFDDAGRRGTWRVPSLRNVALTGPWLHNGSVDRLEEVVRIMATAQLGRSGGLQSWLGDDGSLYSEDRSPLTDRQVADLVAFLQALSSDALRAAATPRAAALPQKGAS